MDCSNDSNDMEEWTFNETLEHACCVGVCPLCYPCFFQKSTPILITIGLVSTCLVVYFDLLFALRFFLTYLLISGEVFVSVLLVVILILCMILILGVSCGKYRKLYHRTISSPAVITSGTELKEDVTDFV